MSTRRLIATALVCGIAILLAGTVQLWRVSRSDREVEVLPIGTRVEMSGVVAGVTRSESTAEAITADVEVAYPDESTKRAAVPDPGGWALLVGGRVVEPASPTTCSPSDGGSPLLVGCHLVFPAAEGTRTLAFRFGDGQRLWRLPD